GVVSRYVFSPHELVVAGSELTQRENFSSQRRPLLAVQAMPAALAAALWVSPQMVVTSQTWVLVSRVTGSALRPMASLVRNLPSWSKDSSSGAAPPQAARRRAIRATGAGWRIPPTKHVAGQDKAL